MFFLCWVFTDNIQVQVNVIIAEYLSDIRIAWQGSEGWRDQLEVMRVNISMITLWALVDSVPLIIMWDVARDFDL